MFLKDILLHYRSVSFCSSVICTPIVFKAAAFRPAVYSNCLSSSGVVFTLIVCPSLNRSFQVYTSHIILVHYFLNSCFDVYCSIHFIAVHLRSIVHINCLFPSQQLFLCVRLSLIFCPLCVSCYKVY
jgi:hypothetical protein